MKDQDYIDVQTTANNVENYEKCVHSFQWTDVEKEFSWYRTGKLNIAYEAIDRHAESEKRDHIALLYKNKAFEEKQLTFQQMKDESNRFGNVLRKLGVLKGDRVFIFMPRIPELYISFFGILKIGGIVGPLFEAFMIAAVRDRLKDSEAVALVTTKELLKRVPVNELPHLKHIIVVGEKDAVNSHVFGFDEEMEKVDAQIEIEWMEREDPMLLHYTSGSTGKPKGILHAHNAMLQYYQTGKWALDLQEEDVYWCTADPGWATGTSYGIFAPWLIGVTNVIYGGRFHPQDWYQLIEEKKVTVWYSAPTAFRMLMGVEDQVVQNYRLSSLRHILSVGEPLNPEVVRWGMKVYHQRIHDNWWMTETGGILISNYPQMKLKPGSMGRPFPGIKAAIIDNKGNELPPYQLGNLAIKKTWPSLMKGVWKNQAKYEEYFKIGDWYVSGDSAFQDSEGYFWYQGRLDDVINTSGKRVGPFEVENKLIEHPAVSEAGVIGKPDAIRGEAIKAFVSLRIGWKPSKNLAEEIQEFVSKSLAGYATPREIQFVEQLPKTRSGKIMRRVLKAWELNLPTGDLSTMED